MSEYVWIASSAHAASSATEPASEELRRRDIRCEARCIPRARERSLRIACASSSLGPFHEHLAPNPRLFDGDTREIGERVAQLSRVLRGAREIDACLGDGDCVRRLLA